MTPSERAQRPTPDAIPPCPTEATHACPTAGAPPCPADAGAPGPTEAATPRAVRTRRRGSTLARAIHGATLLELAETSFEELSFDRIATRAGTGKASLYRRWTSPTELVLTALADPDVGFPRFLTPDTGSFQSDVTLLMNDLARALEQPAGRALRPLMTQRPRHPEVYEEAVRLVIKPMVAAFLDALRAGAERGDVAQRAVSLRVAKTTIQLIIMEHLQNGTVPQDEIRALVEEIVIPLTSLRD